MQNLTNSDFVQFRLGGVYETYTVQANLLLFTTATETEMDISSFNFITTDYHVQFWTESSSVSVSDTNVSKITKNGNDINIYLI